VIGKVVELADTAGKEKFKEDNIIATSLIVDSIRDHLFPHITKIDTSKKMHKALTILFTIKNFGQAMSLKNELHDVRMTDDETWPHTS